MPTIKVVLEYFHPWPNSAGFYYAREQGWYDDLDVQFLLPDPGHGDSLAYLDEGAADFAIFPSNRLLVRREQGAPLLGVAAINHCGLEVIQTVAATGVHRPRDLAGRRVALNPTPRGIAMLRHLVAADGGDPDAVIVVDAGCRELTPDEIAGGRADASFGSYWAWEVLMQSAVPEEQRIVWPVKSIGAPPYHSYLLGAHERLRRERPDILRRFLAASARGFEAVANDPDIALPIYERVTPYFPSSLLARSLRAIAGTWLHEGRWGELRRELLEPYAAWLESVGILRNSDIWRQAVDDAFLPGTNPR